MTQREGEGAPVPGPTGVAVLGSTGSVGRQTLQVIEHHPDRFRVVALAAGANASLLREQVRRHRPDLVALGAPDPDWPAELGPIEVGTEALIAAATHPSAEIVVVASSGHAAILPTHRAIAAGKTIALANKETIVCAGELIVPFAAERGVSIRPVDSEHSAIWQSLGSTPLREVSRLILTASGGPFRSTPAAEMAAVTARDALAHPTWSMGGKITIDSALLMNKGLEVIEARWLFGVPDARIDVLIHPESIVHSLVEFVDGSQIAQLGLPDMRLPIQYALTFPERVAGPHEPLSLASIGALHFEVPDEARFPSLALARRAGNAGATYPTVLSAADEVAVDAFLAGRLRFVEIPEVVSRTLDAHRPEGPLDFDAIMAADVWARSEAAAAVATLNRGAV
ncbi:MAG: 1-deoxy-D-xylulose 5-phosphate reductoisomerase [uncultured Thermomicrobiales bacterium]|uniref:1-deoxy-D-xylulose 5-phosphate reductoisomerase n=1 Tax=uncultured Thermomicrobiales bacterium TaxID=1645740 RepID=A0A6J4VEM7_9BACT|nr:MAG: 1-deoxy-D-xylulose 5-phosphate reductoisomerase [uncultured Thermomicrobiales bacterium]